MELRHLRYFVAVAEELHFGRAAVRLRVVQPALSQQIQRLERELGVPLLLRTKRRVSLTAAGEAFLVEARRTLAAADSAVEFARRAGAGETGRLRIGYVDLAMWGPLPGLLRGYRVEHPGVELRLTELHTAPQRDALRRGDLDVGFLSLRPGEDEFDGLEVASEPLVAALPEDHPGARRARIPLAALAKEPWVLFPPELRTQYLELTHAACSAAGFVPHVVQEARQLHTLTALVSAGLGVTLVPEAVARARRAGVAFRPLAGRAPRLPLHLVWRAGELGSTAQRFVAVVRMLGRTRVAAQAART
jgi:DNA-binding transcriptional LysR family regulator